MHCVKWYISPLYKSVTEVISDLSCMWMNASKALTAHLLSATVRVYSLVAPCHLPDLILLTLLGSVSGWPGLSRGLAWLQEGFKMAAEASKFNPLPLTFTKILHHSSSLSIFGMLSPVYSHARLSPGTSWSSLTAVIYVLLGCKHWWCHNQFLPSFSLEGNYQTS